METSDFLDQLTEIIHEIEENQDEENEDLQDELDDAIINFLVECILDTQDNTTQLLADGLLLITQAHKTSNDVDRLIIPMEVPNVDGEYIYPFEKTILFLALDDGHEAKARLLVEFGCTLTFNIEKVTYHSWPFLFDKIAKYNQLVGPHNILICPPRPPQGGKRKKRRTKKYKK
jgi:hypothetical protein